MAIGIVANIASMNGQSNLYNNENKKGSKPDTQNIKSAYNLDVKTSNIDARNIKYANSNTSLDEIKEQRIDLEEQLGIDFEKESQNFEKSFVLQKEGSLSSSQANISKESALQLL